MAKVYPRTLSSPTPDSSKQEVFTLLMKSLIPGNNGCTVFDSDGLIVYRVDNYYKTCSKQVDIMDAKGKFLFTIVAKKLSVFGSWEGYRSVNTGKNKKKPEFRVTKVLSIRKVMGFLGGASSFKFVVGSDKNRPREYVMEAQICKSSCRIVDNFGNLVAEVKRKITRGGGEDVLTVVVEPYEDHCLVMGLVVVFDLVHRKMEFGMKWQLSIVNKDR